MNTTGWKFPHRIVVDWPVNIEYQGRIWWHTHKTAKQKETGLPCAEYQTDSQERIWLTVTEEIFKD